MAARVARLATADADGRPHLVPVTFDADETTIVFAVDRKPKTTHDLRRLRNIERNPAVCVLADHYDEDWTALWWARADGTAAIVHGGPERAGAVDRLRAKYPRYLADPPDGPAVIVTVTAWSGWAWDAP